jgi:hypothetical protein
MRSHDEPDQVDPTTDAHNVIHVTYLIGHNPKGQGGSSTSISCEAYLTAASYALVCQRLCDSGDSNAPELPITATRTAQLGEPGRNGPETTQACWVFPA